MKYSLLALLIAIAMPTYAEENLAGHMDRHIKSIEIKNAWARATLPSMRASAAYMTIKNNTDKEDCLIKAEAKTISEHTALHSTIEDENGMLSMVHVDDMCIPAHSEVSLSPGKFHIMFMRLTSQLKLGNELPLTLTFKNAGVLHTRADIKSLGHRGMMMHKSDEHGHEHH
jgi:hypothetical protein